MAIEDAKRFLESLSSDDELAREADDAYVEALLSVAGRKGHGFSEDELREALDDGIGELDEAELDHVVGGATVAASSTQYNTAGIGSQFAITFPSTHGTTPVGQTRFGSFSPTGYKR